MRNSNVPWTKLRIRDGESRFNSIWVNVDTPPSVKRITFEHDFDLEPTTEGEPPSKQKKRLQERKRGNSRKAAGLCRTGDTVSNTL